MKHVRNYSDKPDWEIYNLIPYDLEADTVIILPDVNPGKAPLPTGCVVRTKQENWRKFAISDVGCGMLMLKSRFHADAFDAMHQEWDSIVADLRKNKGGLGDLGSGNHFLDALQSEKDGTLYFLIHTGSRDESAKVEGLLDNPVEFDRVFAETIHWAEQNRLSVARVVEKYFGRMEIVVHNNHNHFEHTDDGVVIRKGAVRLAPGELSTLPSHMTGGIVLVRGTEGVQDSLMSISHGTGRVMSRSDAKEASKGYDFAEMRRQVYIPSVISDDSIKTDAPFCYRSIDDVMLLLGGLVEEVERFVPVGYIGHI